MSSTRHKSVNIYTPLRCSASFYYASLFFPCSSFVMFSLFYGWYYRCNTATQLNYFWWMNSNATRRGAAKVYCRDSVEARYKKALVLSLSFVIIFFSHCATSFLASHIISNNVPCLLTWVQLDCIVIKKLLQHAAQFSLPVTSKTTPRDKKQIIRSSCGNWWN